MTKNLILGPLFFLQVLPLLVLRHFSKLSSYAIQRKTDEPNLTKMKKKQQLILNLILSCLAHLTQIWSPNILVAGFTSTNS